MASSTCLATTISSRPRRRRWKPWKHVFWPSSVSPILTEYEPGITSVFTVVPANAGTQCLTLQHVEDARDRRCLFRKAPAPPLSLNRNAFSVRLQLPPAFGLHSQE